MGYRYINVRNVVLDLETKGENILIKRGRFGLTTYLKNKQLGN